MTNTDETIGMGAQSVERVLFLRMAEILEDVVASSTIETPQHLLDICHEVLPEVRDVVARLRGEGGR